MSSKVRVGILGATGAVGQRFIQQLENHPWFELHALGASERSAGRNYESAVRWLLSTPIPDAVRDMQVWPCDLSTQGTPFTACRVVFSALDSSVAGPVEEAFAQYGIAVFSNSKNHRYDPDVPILVPEVNPPHLDIIPFQQKQRNIKGGFIITNPNCSTTGLVVALKPIDDAFGIEEAVVFTMQAVSGAGYPGVASLDILDNVIPFIDGEEDKIEKETRKILGTVESNTSGADTAKHFKNLPIRISAHTNRVPVLDGHTQCVSLRLKKKATPDEVKAVLQNYTSEAQSLKLPSAPKVAIKVLEERDRPQPRIDRERERGYTVSVGRVRGGCCSDEEPRSSFDIRLVLLVHNTVLGAAGGAIINCELAKAKGYL
jgi:aspartate-semialdehyde dehydrogenase